MSDIAPASPLYGPSGGRIDSGSPAKRADRPEAAGRSAQPAPSSQGRKTPERPSDRVDISERARLLAQLAALPEMRQDLVAEVRRQIAAGEYETPERIEAAIEGLLEDME